MKSRPKILVLDDDAELRNLLERYLGEQGFNVRAVAEPMQMDRLLQRNAFDLLVLDLMLDGEDGLSICRRLRNAGDTIPIIMLTARGDHIDRVLGLEMGADDYLPKPFNPRELVARINAHLRRQNYIGGRLAAPDEVIEFGPYRLDLGARALLRNGQPIALTTGEFALLKALASNPRRPLGRDRLIDLARGREHDAADRSVDVQVLRLRRLIEVDPTQPRYIQTVWGFGYVFIPDGGRA